MEFHYINSSLARKLSVTLFAVLSVWWIFIALVFKNESAQANLIWGASYQLMALCGVIFGYIIAKSWGGTRSLVGKTILLFSVGLLLQVFGQSVFSYYNLFLRVNLPYPSLADIGYFLSIPFYIYGTVLLAEVSGARLSLKFIHNKIQAIIIPLILLIASYVVFLRGYEFDWESPLRVFLDFGYPLGQAFYVALALLVFILSKNFLGGLMKPKVLIVLFALAIQYIADYNFLLQAYNETWVNGGYGDYIYLLSYFMMSLALINLGSVFEKIKKEK
jgi:diguanylate cyclase